MTDSCPIAVDVVTRIGVRRLASLHIADGFAAIVRSTDVNRVLCDVTAMGGEVTAAIVSDLLVGYVTIHPIEPVHWQGRTYHRRWERLANARELGSIEVSRLWRGRKIGERLVTSAVCSGAFDASIVISQELSWHWDYENLHLSKREYRALLVRLLAKADFEEFHTDDPNVATDPSNIFMARIGPLVPEAERQRFRELLVTGESW